jgi:hypothetical protein
MSWRYILTAFIGTIIGFVIHSINEILRTRKAELNLHGEVKFSKITTNYQEKYIALIQTYFALIADGKVKVRIMFTQNLHTPSLSADQRDNSYLLLYYQLIKHSFGLQHIEGKHPVSVRLNFDRLPETKAKVAEFKAYISKLTHSAEFRERGVIIAPHDVVEVDSHKHDVLQCLDIILGSVQARLNDQFNEKLEGKRIRS